MLVPRTQAMPSPTPNTTASSTVLVAEEIDAPDAEHSRSASLFLLPDRQPLLKAELHGLEETGGGSIGGFDDGGIV